MKKIKEKTEEIKKKEPQPSLPCKPLTDLKIRLIENSNNPLGYEELDEAFRIALNNNKNKK